MSIQLPKTYDPNESEQKIYKLWEENGFFNPDNLPGKRKKKFVSMLAPPNITGELHMGHALETTLQDILIRMKRMQGYKTLWIPGSDHAGIAAQNAVEKDLKRAGLTRHKLGREKFTERMWAWKEKYGDIILGQLKKLGLSLDWSRFRFTMDLQYQKTVEAVFILYYKKGWIYRGERVVNWCLRCATSISDLEVNYVPEKSKLYFIKYGPFNLATVRPETKLGDTALAVSPGDERYIQYIGKEIEIESVDSDVPANIAPRNKKIKIKIVGDKSVDPQFGTGIIKVTPAHDITDFEISQRHKLPLIKIIDESGRMNHNAGIRYEGLKIQEAREQIVKDLDQLGLIEKIQDYEHNVAHCERCDSVIEPLPSEQWFLKMKDLAKLALEALKKNKIKFHPERWSGPYENWLKNIRDWNISRQLWWGHRLPVWFHEPKCIPKPGRESEIKKCVGTVVSSEKPKCKYCDAEYTQSEDVLDTWFSSALWPFAALGWPLLRQGFGGQSDYKNYYPTDFITSDRSILFLWQARMIFSGVKLTGRAPFKDIFIHPTLLTKEGKRMSKSLGTGVNPLDLIEKYGTDALRFGLAYQTTGIQDMRFNEDVILMGKKFANKLWNITRYVILKLGEDYAPSGRKPQNATTKKADDIAVHVTENIERYNFGEAAHGLYDFIWHEFADKYIEETKNKNDRETKDALIYTLAKMLKLLHPFMPFVTEELYAQLPPKEKGLLIVEKWPRPSFGFKNKEVEGPRFVKDESGPAL